MQAAPPDRIERLRRFGTELGISFAAGAGLFAWLGVPRSAALLAVTGGVGVALRGFGLDLGLAHYQGSAKDLHQSHGVVALTLRYAAE